MTAKARKRARVMATVRAKTLGKSGPSMQTGLMKGKDGPAASSTEPSTAVGETDTKADADAAAQYAEVMQGVRVGIPTAHTQA